MPSFYSFLNERPRQQLIISVLYLSFDSTGCNVGRRKVYLHEYLSQVLVLRLASTRRDTLVRLTNATLLHAVASLVVLVLRIERLELLQSLEARWCTPCSLDLSSTEAIQAAVL